MFCDGAMRKLASARVRIDSAEQVRTTPEATCSGDTPLPECHIMCRLTLLTILCLAVCVLISSIDAVKIYNATFTSDDGEEGYVFKGKGMKGHCNYELEGNERLESISFEKFGKEHYFWDAANAFDPVAKNGFFGKVDLKFKPHNVVYIPSSYLGMSGPYDCIVRTTSGDEAKKTAQLMVIETCKKPEFKSRHNLETCTEIFTFNCDMYPRPVGACGLYNEKTERYIISHTFNTRRTGGITFNLDVTIPIEARNIKDKQNTVVRCDLTIAKSHWKLQVSSPLFKEEKGCKEPKSPPRSEGKFSFNGTRTCLDFHAEKTEAKHSQVEDLKILCHNRKWYFADSTVYKSDSHREISKNLTEYTVDGSDTFSANNGSDPTNSGSILLTFLLLLLLATVSILRL